MSINQKALLQTVAFISGVIGFAVLVTYLLSLIGPAAAGIFSCILLLGVFAYLVYGVVKARLEYQESLDKLNSIK